MKQIRNEIERARRVLLVPHQNPDGDALGSVTAFLAYLKRIGIPGAIFCKTKASPRLAFLHGSDELTTDERAWDHPELDVVIVFDSSDPRYAGIHDCLEGMARRPKVIVIDHHYTNSFFGDINLVDPTASSTVEIIYRFFQAGDVRMSAEMATSLLTGLLTDTDNFTNGATSASALAMGRDLLLRGGDRSLIMKSVFRDKSVGTLKLWGVTLSRLQKHGALDLVYTHVSQQDIVSANAADADVEGIANFLNAIGEAKATLLLKETADGSCKGSFRTTRDDTDVSRFAKRLGGGGHRKAAGFTVEGPIDAAFARIFVVLQTLEKTDTLPSDISYA